MLCKKRKLNNVTAVFENLPLSHTSDLGVDQVSVTMESYNEFQQEGKEGRRRRDNSTV